MKTTLYLSAIKASKQVLIAGLASFLPLFFEEIKKRSPLLHHFSINVDIIYCVLSNNMCIALKKILRFVFQIIRGNLFLNVAIFCIIYIKKNLLAPLDFLAMMRLYPVYFTYDMLPTCKVNIVMFSVRRL